MKQEFKYKIAYKCKNQEKKDEICKYLEDIGYEKHEYGNEWVSEPYIITSYLESHYFSDLQLAGDTRTREEIQSKELFLALACCSNLEEGIKGEYWKCVAEDIDFTVGKLYQATCNLKSSRCFIDDSGDKNGFPNYKLNLKNFVKATKEEIEAFVLPQSKPLMKQSVTITQAKLFQYIQNAQKEKPSIVEILAGEFPNLWGDEYKVTREFYNKVLKEIGNCPIWIEKLKQDFKEFHVPQYELVVGEEVFCSSEMSAYWVILKYKGKNENQRTFHHLNNNSTSSTYSYCIPVKAVFPQYPYPQLGIHY